MNKAIKASVIGQRLFAKERMKTMFAIGKLPPEILEKIVMEPMQASRVKREDVILRPKTGEDCSAVDLCRLTATIFIPPVRSRWAFF